MANRRNVKKDIEYITYTVVHDCMSHLELDNEKTHDEVVGLIAQAVQTRNDLFSKVNHQEKGKRSVVRAYYREIYKALLDNADQSFVKLSAVITKK
jgi:hypothetical protein